MKIVLIHTNFFWACALKDLVEQLHRIGSVTVVNDYRDIKYREHRIFFIVESSIMAKSQYRLADIIHREFPESKVCLSDADEGNIEALELKRSIDGVIFKTNTPSEAISVLTQLASRDGQLAYMLPESLSEAVSGEVESISSMLSPSQLVVFKLLEMGYSNDDIAAKLNIRVGTVKSHLHRIYVKFGVKSFKELLRK